MKHPVLTNKVRLIVWWLAWLFLALGQSLIFYFAYGSFIEISIYDGLISLIIYSGIALSLWYPFNFFNTGNKRVLTLMMNLALSGAISIIIWILLTKSIMTLILPKGNNYLAF